MDKKTKELIDNLNDAVITIEATVARLEATYASLAYLKHMQERDKGTTIISHSDKEYH